MYLYEVGTQSSVLINLMSEVTFKKGSSVEAFFHEGDLTFCINNIFWLLSQYFLQTVKTSKAAVAHSTSLTQVWSSEKAGQNTAERFKVYSQFS